jgi:hypothetical protein
MHFAVAQHIEVAAQLSTLWAAVSLATRSILEHLPVNVPQVGIVVEVAIQFWEGVDWCLRLEAAGLEICDLALGSAGN